MMEAGLAHIRESVMPALQQFEGFIGLSVMVDRMSGRCIATSAWRDEEAMRASQDRIMPIRNEAADTFGGTATVDEWEIAVMHRDHQSHEGACARATWIQTDRTAVDDGIETYRMGALPNIEQLAGFCSASLMVNRHTGQAVSTVCFENREAMESSRDTAEQIRSAASRQASATVLDIREFEMAMAHLRVPEMA
jgi:hypothetical protein